jgi:hypothetical protein
MLGMLTADLLETNIICVPADLDTKAALALFIARASREKDKEIEGDRHDVPVISREISV